MIRPSSNCMKIGGDVAYTNSSQPWKNKEHISLPGPLLKRYGINCFSLKYIENIPYSLQISPPFNFRLEGGAKIKESQLVPSQRGAKIRGSKF